MNKLKTHIRNISNCTLYIVKFLTGLIPCFWPFFIDFRNEVPGLCVNNSINEGMKWIFMIRQFSFNSYLSNPCRIFRIEAMEAVL